MIKSVCIPALDEVGLLLRDKVRYWRLNNILSILDKAKGKLHYENEELKIQAHPRVALSIIENGSLNDNDEIQEMWAGLFASSCTKSGHNDENLIFVDLLKQLTVSEAKIIKYSCEIARKIIYENGLLIADKLKIDCESLMRISGINEIYRLDRELDHLSSLELLGLGQSGGGIDINDKNLVAHITPSTLALNLYVKSQGHNDNPILFWRDNVINRCDTENEKRKDI